MLRLLIVLALCVWAIRALSRATTGQRAIDDFERSYQKAKEVERAVMVPCARCGTFVPEPTEATGTSQPVFCSRCDYNA